MATKLLLFKLISENSQIPLSTTKINIFRNKIRLQTTASTNGPPLKTMADMPGLSSLPIIGPLHHFIPGIGKIGLNANLYELLNTLEKEYGPVVKMEVFKRSKMVILFNPEDYNKVFRAEETSPSRPGFDTMTYYRTVLRKSTYDGVYGLTTAEGSQWRDFRTKVNPALLMPKLVKLYTPGITAVADEMVYRLKKLKDDHKYIESNFHFEMTKYSLESVAVVALGTRLGCLQDNLPEDHPASQLIKSALEIMPLSFKLEFLPSLWRYYETSTFKKFVKALDTQWSISEKYIEEAKHRFAERGHDIPEEDKSVIEKLLAIDKNVAVMMANEMLLAGIDTVAFTLINVLYHLGNNKEKQDKLREEIRLEGNRRPYLRACIKEALRIYPVVPGNLRRMTKEHIVAGYIIPVGVDVISPNESLSKSERYYPRAKEYIPERWIVDKSDPLYYGNAPPTVTQPFGFGVRSCIGRRIAELEIETFISKVIDNFEVTWDGPPAKVITRVTNCFVKPYKFNFKFIK